MNDDAPATTVRGILSSASLALGPPVYPRPRASSSYPYVCLADVPTAHPPPLGMYIHSSFSLALYNVTTLSPYTDELDLLDDVDGPL